MRKKLIVAAISLASVVWVATQQVDDQNAETPVPAPDPQPPIEDADMRAVGIDPVTFQVAPLSDTSPIDSGALEGYNEPEQIGEREKLLLLANAADEYLKRFPKSQEELDGEEKAKFEINNPISYVEKLHKEIDPERIKEMIRSMDEILDPVGYHAKRQKEPKVKPDRP